MLTFEAEDAGPCQGHTGVPVCLPQWTEHTISSAFAYGKVLAHGIFRRLMYITPTALWTRWMPVVLGCDVQAAGPCAPGRSRRHGRSLPTTLMDAMVAFLTISSASAMICGRRQDHRGGGRL